MENSENSTVEVQVRLQKLKSLYNSICGHCDEIAAALKNDFNKNEFDSYATEIGLVLAETRHAIKHLRKWAKPKRVGVSLQNFPGSGRIITEPFGKVLIIAPWNYPFQLSMMPLVGAIAAGNSVTLKPSAKTPATYNIIKKIVSEVFSPKEVDITDSRDVLDKKFDFIFFTGGAETGKRVLRAAAENLTPCALELGGKSPAIVDCTADVELAARRLAWAKYLNAGQTCVAPDYICVHKSVIEQFTKSFIREIKSQYFASGIISDDFPFLINVEKGEEMKKIISGSKILFGGEIMGRLMYPTVISADFNSECMKDEIFAPLAPLIEFDDLKELSKEINSRPKPLALYYFGKNKKAALEIPFGGGAINDAVIHVAEHSLPFGGVGDSGMGSYHGKASFDAFSHCKSVLIKNSADVKMRYAPHTTKAIKFLKKIVK